MSKYNGEQQTIIQKAIDSGILNNTRRTHEFVDLIAKISADKGVSFDFTNNERLKESGFAVGDATVNGFVTKDGVTLNIQSAKSLNSVVGHEISHVLEGTELYTELQNAVFEYAKTKGEYDSRLKALTELYKKVADADVNAELTADLVGDYLFKDADFVRKLSTDHRNVFQKIYDEVKYLLKVATAGSEEARKLEKVKKAFEDAYREETKNTAKDGGAKYALERVGDISYVKSDKNLFVKEDGTMASEKEVFDSLVGKTLHLPDGEIKIVSRLPGKNMYSELSKRHPRYWDGVENVKQLNSDVNYNMEELLANSTAKTLDVPDKDGRHEKQGVASFDTRTVNFFDGEKAYEIQFSIATLQNGEKVAYAKKFFGYDVELTKKIQTAETMGEKSQLNQRSASDTRIADNSSGVKRQFSLTDNTGKQLSKNQQDYFKDSKMRDDDGNLMVMYHGSQDAGFHTFDSDFSDDGRSFFFVDRNDVAASYSGTSETYEARTMHTAEDVNNFIAEIDAEGYEVVEKDGQFVLLYEGERVAASDTAKGIYDEFRWYEGVGEGDANYKVYLNLTNPLVVDANGKNWNNVSREYSQEIADRYHSLTAEEKAALTDLAEWGDYGVFRDEMLESRATAEQGGSGMFDEAYTKNLARAYEKLGGANANLYDAFTIASDNFSAESIQQFAVKQMNTRDYAKQAKEQGYDGVIFKNIVDNGGYSNGSEGASTVAIAFDSNQIKSTANSNPTKDADIRYSLSSMGNTFFGNESMSVEEFTAEDYKRTTGYQNYVNECLDNYKQTRGKQYDETVARKEIEDSIDGIVRVAIAAKKAGYDIFDDGVKRSKTDSKKRLLFSSLEPNSDYFTSSDISTICDKRKNFADIYDDIVRAEEAKGIPQGKRFFDNIDNYFYLHGILAEKGLTQPCRQCYVESMRKNLAPMASAFLRLVNETDANNTANDQLYQQKGKNKGTLKTNNAALRERVLDILAEYEMSASDLTVEMLTTEDGLAQLKITAPLVYEAFNSFYGQSKPKMPKSATPFRFGELTALLTDEKGKIKQSLVDKINATGGFRLQSYSDFQIQNYTDVLQVIFEAGTLGLNGHAYTKVPAFLEATEGTNLKRNISIFMYKDGDEWKLDRNDSFPYTLEEIYDIVKADKTGNTGIIAVSQNEDMSAWIMANDFIAYGIPFHKSGLKMGTVRDTDINTEDGRVVKGYSGTKDHTRQQTEVWAKTTDDHKALTKVKNGINIYEFWDFDNKANLSKNELIEKNVKAYIDACEKAGYLPKFREYVMNNGKVLNSTLAYAKELGFVPQDATIEDISFEYKGYTIPYGYYKFLGDFGMFTPDGQASPHETLSLNDYDFDKAVKFFEDSETLRRNEILQQFANDGERQKYAESNLTAGELLEVIKQKRVSVVGDVLSRYSLSREGEIAPTYGTYNVRGEDIALETAPVAEEITPVEDVAPTKPLTADDMISAIQDKEFELQGYDPDAVAYAPASEEEAQAAARRDFRRITDKDAPAEVQRAQPEVKPETANDPFLRRDWDDRKTKAFTTDNPDAKPFFKEAAEKLAEDFAYTQPAERGFSQEAYYESGGEKGFWGWGRKAAPDINTLMDVYGLSYAQITEGLDAIINDTAKVNNKAAKTIEFMLNDRLLKGTTMWYSGEEIPPNQGYIEWLNEQEHAKASAEDFASITDADAPMVDDIAPMPKNDSVLYNKREGENGWGKVYPGAWEALYDAVKNTNSEFLDALADEEGVPIESGSNEIVVGSMPITDSFSTTEDAVRREAITPMQGAQILSDAYNLGGVDVLKKLRYLHADNLYEEWTTLANQIGFAPIAENVTNAPVLGGENVTTAPKSVAYEAIKPKQTKEPRMAKATKAEQVTAKVLTEEPTAEKKKGGLWKWAKNSVLDKGMVFEDLSLATGNRELQARWNSIRYADGKAQKLIGDGNAKVKSLASMQEAVEESGKTLQFYEYLYHNLNVDRMTLENRYGVPNKAVFGDNVTADASRARVAALEKENPELKRYAKDVYDYLNYLREELVAGGVISRETANLWQEMYPHYVPIRRVGDDGLNINVPLDTGRTGVNAPIKRAIGGNRDILPLFDTMGQRTMQTFKAIAKNRFGVELKNTLGTTIESDTASIDDTIDSIDTQDGLLQEGKNGRKPTFTVFENGEKVTFEITDEMYDAMKPTSEILAKTIKPLNAVSNFRRATLTEYNPWFMLKNAVKDVQDVLINSQHAAKTYAAIPKAIAQMKSKGKWYQEYIENGGEQNTYFDKETNTFTKENMVAETLKKITGLNAIQKANNVIEMLPRLSEYIASRESGRSIDVSMLDAARVTTNFAAGGDLTKAINRNGATFLNASVQGAIQQVRNIREAKHNGLKGWAKLAGTYVLAGLPALLLNGLIWDDDEEYEELSDYVKQNYYIVGKYGDGKFVRIPKGRTVAVIQNAFEQMGNAVTGDDEVDLKTFVELVANNLAPNNPVDNNIFSPIAQVMNNETWYGEDLVPTRLQDLPAAEQYDESTDSISRWLGEATNTSPYKWNYLLDQYSGVIGDTFLPMMTPEAESGDNSFAGNMIAPLKDMFTTDSVMNNQNVSNFYDTVDKLTTNAKGSNATDEDVLKYKYMNSVNSELGELYGQKREIQNSNLPDDEKYEAVRETQRLIDEIAAEALASYEGVAITDDYATVGDRHYHKNDEGEWVKVSDEQLEKQNAVTSELGIDPDEYWANKEEYDYAYKNPGKHAISKAVGGYEVYRGYTSELYDLKADKDENGETISGSAKEKKMAYIESLDLDYGQKLILHRSLYDSKEDKRKYNQAIVEYLDSREDISWDDMKSILEELDFTVYDDGTIEW